VKRYEAKLPNFAPRISALLPAASKIPTSKNKYQRRTVETLLSKKKKKIENRGAKTQDLLKSVFHFEGCLCHHPFPMLVIGVHPSFRQHFLQNLCGNVYSGGLIKWLKK